MRRLEREYVRQSGTPDLELMERAAGEVCAVLCDMLGGAHGKRALFLCGPGNNGGDGYAAARLFARAGGAADILVWGDAGRLPPSAAVNYRRLKEMSEIQCTQTTLTNPDNHGPIRWLTVADLSAIAGSDTAPYDALVDALLGIGLDRPVAPDMADLFEQAAKLRTRGAKVLAVDIPSGVSARTGRIMGAAINADHTVTFEYAKPGHFLADGADVSGDLHAHSIGMAGHEVSGDVYNLYEDTDAAAMFPPRKRNTHKGDYGRLLIIAGSVGMAGAAALCARGALRSGVGLVTVACPERIMPIVQTLAPSAMVLPLPEEETDAATARQSGAIGYNAIEPLRAALKRADALVIGPGLSANAHWGIVQLALMSGLPAVIDADALNIIAKRRDLLKLFRAWHVITPHPAEAARLLGESAIADDSAEAARRLAALGPTVLYKGNASLIIGEKRYIVASGSPGMATGGSGDVLSGVIGAQLARGVAATQAATLGAFLCGRAGEAAAEKWGETSMTSADLPDALAKVLRALPR